MRFPPAAAAALIASTAAAACAGPPAAVPGPSALATARPLALATPVVLQGVSHLSGGAPLIVQVENSQFARPQSGLGSATIVYEYVAEGGISRFSAIFALPPPVMVGPVRSARLATLQLLQLYRGVLVYSGGSQYIEGLLAASRRPHYNETSAQGDLFRISGRSAPHNLYTDGSHLADLLGRSRAAQIGYPYPAETAPGSGGVTVRTCTVPISPSENPVWTWQPAMQGWTRTEPDTGPVIDANTGQPVVATTVILQQVAIATSANVIDVNGVHGVSHTLTGTGKAQVFAGGREYDATWTQPAAGPPTYTLLGGAPAPIAPGLIFIELVATGSPATISR